MKVVILAGGLGTRISEYSKTIPKPMIKIGNKPIVEHIMKHYSEFGHNEFYLALGYKGQYFRRYFKNKKFPWKIHLINTGKNTMTGGRIKKLKKFLKNETFLLTYGDGVSNVNIKNLINFHQKNKKLITMTCVRPPARFGAVKLEGKYVKYFKEKSTIDEAWINGGYFVIDPKFLNLIRNDKTFLEKEPLEKASKKKQLIAYKHLKFWQCMDTKRDKDFLEKIWKKNKSWSYID